MNALPTDIYSVATIREIDRAAIDGGTPGYTLMTRAAAAAVRQARSRFPNAACWQIICGAGNNAGDGYAVARLAAGEGITVSVLAIADAETLTGDAATAYEQFLADGGTVAPWRGEIDAGAKLLVDAMLGSGLARNVDGDYAAAVAAINAGAKPVMALDIPTGLHGDTGAVMGDAVQASLTVTFVGLKQGLFVGRGPDLRGTLGYSGLDIGPACYSGKAVELRRIAGESIATLLPRRSRSAHKGDFGHVLVVGGGPGMPGAVVLCGEAALRSGAGRVSVATDRSHAAVVVKDRPELMAQGIGMASNLTTLLGRTNVIAVGPGLGRSNWANELMAMISKDSRPAVWDADALNWLAEHPQSAANRIITPHPGEAATLLGVTAADIQSDRRGSLLELQQRYGGVVVLKGSGSLVSSASGPPWISASGNPGMAAPGMGDVLTGVIASLVAQGLSLEDAAMAGVEIHARAGDLAAQDGERGLLASDLLARLRGVVNR